MKQRILALATASALAGLVTGCASPGHPASMANPAVAADSIYLGGPILTRAPTC